MKRDVLMRAGTIEVVKRGASHYDCRDPYHIALEMLEGIKPGCNANARLSAFTDAFFFSIETLATVGYGTMAPATLYGHVVSAIEIVFGVVFTAIMTGLLFVRFSKPRSKILFAFQTVVTSHNCSPTLMVRLANGSLTLLTNATVRLGVLLPEVIADGHSFRYVHDLALSNATLPLFALTWTVMHRIDASPLADYDAEQFVESDPRLF